MIAEVTELDSEFCQNHHCMHFILPGQLLNLFYHA